MHALSDPVLLYPILVLTGVAAGFLNVMAGGGSLLSLPLLVLMGMPTATANGTSRIPLIPQNVVAMRGFKKAGYWDLKLSLTLGACTLPGAILGVTYAVKIDDDWFRRVLAVVMVGVLVVTLWPQRKIKPGPPGPPSRARFITAHVAMVGIGFYGGFIQAGVGFMLMPVLQRLLNLDLVRVNMHKVVIVLIYMLPVLVIFAYHGHLAWIPGIALAVGSAAGAEIATRTQIKKGEGPIRVIFALAVVAMAVKLLWG